jgi:hypothetical protein
MRAKFPNRQSEKNEELLPGLLLIKIGLVSRVVLEAGFGFPMMEPSEEGGSLFICAHFGGFRLVNCFATGGPPAAIDKLPDESMDYLRRKRYNALA